MYIVSKTVHGSVSYFHSFCLFVSFQLRPRRRHLCRVLREDPHWKCMLLTVLLVASLVVILWCRFSLRVYSSVSPYKDSPCRDGYSYIPAAFFSLLYLVYVVECWHSQTRLAITFKEDVDSVYQRIRRLREAYPVVWWRAISYHYSRYTRQVTHYRHGDTFTSTQEVYQRINTHSAAGAFDFSSCGVKDVSCETGGLEDHPMTRIIFNKNFMFLNEQAENDYLSQRARFFAEHEERDENMETREGLGLTDPEYVDDMVSYANSDKLPKYICLPLFWLASLLLLSWPYRLVVSLKTSVMDYHVEKLFGCLYVNSISSMEHWNGESIQNTPSRFFIGSQASLETFILGNRQLAPSYSEAVLMDKDNINSLPSVRSPQGPGPPPLTGSTGVIPNAGAWTSDQPPFQRRQRHNALTRTVPSLLSLIHYNNRNNRAKCGVRRAFHSWSNFRDIRISAPSSPTSMHSQLVSSGSGLALVSMRDATTVGVGTPVANPAVTSNTRTTPRELSTSQSESISNPLSASEQGAPEQAESDPSGNSAKLHRRPTSLPLANVVQLQPQIRILLSPNIDSNPIPAAETTWVPQANSQLSRQLACGRLPNICMETPDYSPPSYSSAMQSQNELNAGVNDVNGGRGRGGDSGEDADSNVQKETVV